MAFEYTPNRWEFVSGVHNKYRGNRFDCFDAYDRYILLMRLEAIFRYMDRKGI